MQYGEWIYATASAFAGGGLVGVLTVFRKSKKDRMESNFDYIREWNSQFTEREKGWQEKIDKQDAQIAKMNRELGELSGRLIQMSSVNATKDVEIASLKNDVSRLTTELATERATAAALASTALANAAQHTTKVTVKDTH